jgi:hypothetical protein
MSIFAKTIGSKKTLSVRFLENEETDVYVIGEYKISSQCRNSVHCQHIVFLNNGATKCVLNGKQIQEMLERKGLSHPHFERFRLAKCPEDRFRITKYPEDEFLKAPTPAVKSKNKDPPKETVVVFDSSEASTCCLCCDVCWLQ